MRSNSVNIETFKDMLKRYEDFKMKNKREPRVIFIRSGGGESIPLETFRDMLRRYEDFVRINGREPNYISIQPQPNGKIEIKKFRDMLRRYEEFKKKNGREPALIYLDPLGRSGDYVTLKAFKDMLRRYEEFMKREGREPRYIEINPVLRPKLNGVWTKKVMVVLGDFKDATGLYKLVAGKCKYKYYYNDQYRSEDALKRMTTVGINCTDACQLFEKVFLEMGYEARIEHCKVKCRDGEWYGHYLLNLRGYEFRDWVVWDYVSATQTGRPLGRPCCVDGFKHLGYGVIGGVYG